MKNVKVRITHELCEKLTTHLFSRYPDKEAATFLDCGFAVGVESLIVTIKDLFLPKEGDMDSETGGVGLKEPYSLRFALASESNSSALGLVHSHPESCATFPSTIDDDMDSYYSEYFKGFAKSRPYVSLILSADEAGQLRFSGRVFCNGKWLLCSSLQVVGDNNEIVYADNYPLKEVPAEVEERLERFTGVLGKKSAKQLWQLQAVIIGAGGTGSPLFHSLVRSCVGKIIVIDPQYGAASNTERIHGFYHADLKGEPKLKVEMLKRLSDNINPNLEVIIVPFDARSEIAQKFILESDIILGCTDSQVGRVMVSDFSLRFLLPAFHMTVSMETHANKLSAEVIHITKYAPHLPCVYCRSQVDAQRLAQELMSPEERAQRQKDEAEMKAKKGMYWVDEPVIHTVGSLTTIAAELSANYSIGLITGLYKMPADFMEIDLLKLDKGAVCFPMKKRSACMCKDRNGLAAQGEPWIGNV